MVRNHGMAYKSGTKPIESKWFRKTGSWKAMRWENLAKYSCMTTALSFQKKLCKYFGMKAAKQAYAKAVKERLQLVSLTKITILLIITLIVEVEEQERGS